MKKKFDNGEKIMCWDDYFVVYTLKMKIYYKNMIIILGLGSKIT